MPQPLGTEVDVDPDDVVLDGDPAPCPRKGHSSSVSFRSMYIVAKQLPISATAEHLFVTGNVRAPYSSGSNFRQYFYGISYLGHPLTSTENFTEIVPGEPLRRGT